MMPRPTPDILAGLGQGDGDAVTLAMGPQVMALNISQVRLDGGTQPRAGIDQAVVEDYANDMEANGAEFPPVQVVYDGADYWLWDGFHRLHARKRNGLYTVPAIVRQGTRRDAVLLSVGANATHGFRRTNEDKRRAVLALLEDEEWGQWADREIARRCAVSHTLVANLRAELSGNGCQIETRRVQRNGTEYTMATPQRTPAPAVDSQAANYAGVWEIEQVIRAWLPAFEEPLAVLENLKQHKGGSAYFDDLIEAGDLPTPHRKGDIFQAVNNVLDQMRQRQPAAPFVPADIEEQVEVEPPAQPSTNGRAAFASEQVKVIDWRRTRGTVTEDGRILVQMSDGTKSPPWLELDDAGQHWMLSLISEAQEVRR